MEQKEITMPENKVGIDDIDKGAGKDPAKNAPTELPVNTTLPTTPSTTTDPERQEAPSPSTELPTTETTVTPQEPDSKRQQLDITPVLQAAPLTPASGEAPVPTPILSSVRFRLALVCWFGFAVMYAQRTNLSIAMVCMTKSIAHNTTGNTSTSDEKCPELEHTSRGGFDWDKSLQGNILGSFFYGYLLLQIPGGMVSERFGAKHVITVGMLPVAVLTILTPELTKVHYSILIIIRVIVGLGQAVFYPAATALWGKWSPPLERSMLVGISMSGGQFGNAFALPVGGILCEEFGWESIFYVIGAFGLLFVVMWAAWVHGSPAEHKGLSDAERTYLEKAIVTTSSKSPPKDIPWKAIFSSLPVWAIIVAHSFGNYTYYMNLTQIPTYMKEVLKFNIKANGAFSMLPYLVFWLSTMAAGVASDFIIANGVKMVVIRKVFAATGLIGPAAFLVATAYIDCTQKYLAVFTLCCAVGFTGFGFASYMVNHGDLAPDYAGTLFGISNSFATLPGFIAPAIVGSITIDGTVQQWRSAFFLAAGINVAGAVIYILFASSSLQPWSSTYKKEEELTDVEKGKEYTTLKRVSTFSTA